MSWNIFLLELRLLARDKSAWVLLVLFAGTVSYGISNGKAAGVRVSDAGEGARDAVTKSHNNIKQALRKRAENSGGQQAAYPSDYVASRGFSAVMPPAPIPALAVGQSDLSPPSEVVSIFGSSKPAENRAEIENPSHLLSGSFDLAFVLIWLFPLFLLGLTYDLMAGDRETGTLRIALAQGISPFGWMLRRSIARSLPLVIVACLAVLIAWSSSEAEVAFARAAFAIGVVVAYSLFWIALSMAVNTVAKGAASAATALGSAWVLFVLVAPTLLNVADEATYPTPSRAELVAAARQEALVVEKKARDVANSFYESHPELAPKNRRGMIFSQRLIREQEVFEAVSPTIEKFDSQVEEQQATVAKWRFISPAIAAHEALTDLAGTGYWRYRAFREQVEGYEKAITDHFHDKVHRGDGFTLNDYPLVPQFQFEEPDNDEWTSRAGVGIAGILGLAVVFGLWALVGLRSSRMGRLSA